MGIKTRKELIDMVKTAKLAKIIGGITAIIGLVLFFSTFYNSVVASFTSVENFMTLVIIGSVGIVGLGLLVFFMGVYFDHPSHR
jgi:ABC-type nickel/cobalt efflux system permease component RcnA